MWWRTSSNNWINRPKAAKARCGLHCGLRSRVRVLPDWSMAPLGVYAVTAQRESQPAKVRLAIAALQAYLAD